MNKNLQELLNHDETMNCIQCGYCLPACPTYKSMGKESASPRGRINLVKMAAEGKIDIQEQLAGPIDLCLGCRACETACPVGVDYGSILDSAKVAIYQSQKDTPKEPKLKHWILEYLFTNQQRLNTLGNLTYLYQKLGLQHVMRSVPFIQNRLGSLGKFEVTLPDLESPIKRPKLGKIFPAKGITKYKVAFFTGCVMNAFMYKINRLTIEILNQVGCEVTIPENQTCCGALHVHSGDREAAQNLAVKNIIAFEEGQYDWMINNAGGCGAALKEYSHLFEDELWKERAKRFEEKNVDISVLLAQIKNIPFVKEIPTRATYQDSCHLTHVQKVTKEPRQILHSIPGTEFVELPDHEKCCGSGGIYNLVNFHESMKILDQKMENVYTTKATTLVTTNPGCLLQMKQGIIRAGKQDEIRVIHLVELVAEAMDIY